MLIPVVPFQHSTSPSTKMAALSQQFTGRGDADLNVGTPPNKSIPTLSRKVQSELNLTKLGRVQSSKSIEHSSITSGFSGGCGDPLPDKMSSPIAAVIEMTVDCDAIIALCEVYQSYPIPVHARY
jgi:hypothetical protein